jgi:hypothetical protein
MLTKQAQRYLQKTAFFAVAPFKAGDEDYISSKAYAKEYFNSLAGSTLGMLPGLALATTGVNNPKMFVPALGLAAVGAVTGGIRSTNKSRAQYNKPAYSVSEYLARATGSALGGAVVPLAGSVLMDYSLRKSFEPDDIKSKRKN